MSFWELLRYRFEQIDFIDEPVDLGFDCPLDLHCTYTRDQILVAHGLYEACNSARRCQMAAG